MKKILSIITLLMCMFSPLSLGEISVINQHKGLQRLEEDKIENNAHARFNNVYITDEHNIRVVKGRDKLNTTANADTTINMLCYYENSSGTKKLVVKESDEFVTYDTNWTNRSTLTGGTGLTNEKADCTQIGDDMYINSSTDGLYRYIGGASITAITGVTAPSSVNFSATSGDGGLTPGLPAHVVHQVDLKNGGTSSGYPSGATSCVTPVIEVKDYTEDNTACTSLSAQFTKTCATNSTYAYKVVYYSTLWGIETEPSSADTATLTGANTVNVSGRTCFACFTDATCSTGTQTCCEDTVITVTGEQTRTSGALGSAPSAPFDQTCVYRTVAGGSDYFLVGCQPSGTFTDGKPDNALTRPLDTTINTIDPPTFRYIEEYKGSIFTAEDNKVRFTRLPIETITNSWKYWLDTDLLNTGLAHSITGLHSITNNLLIFTSDTVLSLSGFGVDSFRLSRLLTGVGTVSDETIETDNNGDVIFFAGVQGVYKLRIGQQRTDDLTGAVINQADTNIVRISSPFLDDVFAGLDSEIVLDPADYTSAHSYYDRDRDLYFLYIDNQAFLFNNKSSEWSYIPATQMIASVYYASPNSSGQAVIVDNLGFAYNNWKGYENGVESGTVTGTPTSSTSTSLTDSGASYSVSGDGLKGTWVFVDNEAGEYRQIQSNTATTLTVSPAWTVNPVTSDDYYIGYIVVDFKTKQYTLAEPPARVKVDNIYLVHSKASSSQQLELITYEEKSSIPNNLKPIDLSTNYVDKRLMPMGIGKYWFQWQGRSFVYNISDTTAAPVEIQNYAVDWTEMEEL